MCIRDRRIGYGYYGVIISLTRGYGQNNSFFSLLKQSFYFYYCNTKINFLDPKIIRHKENMQYANQYFPLFLLLLPPFFSHTISLSIYPPFY